MRILTTSVAGLALFALALAPSAEAQQRAQSDADQPGVTLPDRSETPSADVPGMDQDLRRHVRLPASAQAPTPPDSDQDDLTRSRALPKTVAAEPELNDGRRDAGLTAVPSRGAENLFPDGRDVEAVASAKAPAGPRTMTVDGRPLDAKPGAPVLDEAAPALAESVPEAGLEVGDVPSEIVLGANSPNPFEGTTRITFSLPLAASATLTLYDVRGREVSTLFDGAATAGTHAVSLDASALAAGTYVYVLDVNGERLSRRLQVAR